MSKEMNKGMNKEMRYGLALCCLASLILVSCVKPEAGTGQAAVTDEGQAAEPGYESEPWHEEKPGQTVAEDRQSRGGSETAGHEYQEGWKDEVWKDKDDVEGENDSVNMDYILPESSFHLYSQNDLDKLSEKQLNLARNEIYARHGRKFKDEGLQAYFQGKSWYQGTVEPDRFDEAQLNQTELDNIKLLTSLEQERKDGRSGYPAAPYAEAFAAWDGQHGDRKVSEKLFPDGCGNVLTTEKSRIITHDRYYEVTDCVVMADDVYDSTLFKGKQEGDRVTIDGEEFLISAMTVGADGLRSCTLTYVNQDGKSAELTPKGWVAYISLQEISQGFYQKLDNDICGPSQLIYEGSIYFYRDARIETGMMDGRKTITAREYFETVPSHEYPEDADPARWFTRAGGLQKDGSVVLQGIPQYDENYYFTGFEEVSRNWIG